MTSERPRLDDDTGDLVGSPPIFDTFLQALDIAVATVPDQIFLDFDEGPLTYREADDRSTQMARKLAGIGVERGATVVTVLDSTADAIFIWFALSKLGAIWVPINTAYRGAFLRHQMTDSAARLLICETHYLDEFSNELDGTHIERVLYRGEVPKAAWPAVAIAPLDTDAQVDEGLVITPPGGRDIACLIYTSGTTGVSKGCIISHKYFCNGGRQHNISVPPLPNDIIWTCMPLFHISGSSYVVLSTLFARGRARIARRFSVSNFWQDIERSAATTALMVASMFPLLAQAPDNDAMLRCRGQLRAVTGIPLTLRDRKIWTERFGVGYLNSFAYGQTEASKICNLPWGSATPPLDSCGPPSEDFGVIIADESGNPVLPGVVGEILVRPQRSGVMFSGYWGRPADTVQVWQNLWMHSGDLGRMDAAGNLYFVDRIKDYVRSRGENISSVEVETLLGSHRAVKEAAFHAVVALDGGEDDLKATLVIESETALTEKELCLWMIEHLPHFAIPRYIEFRNELPKTPTGRIQKQKLREEGYTATTWDAKAHGIVARRKKTP